MKKVSSLSAVLCCAFLVAAPVLAKAPLEGEPDWESIERAVNSHDNHLTEEERRQLLLIKQQKENKDQQEPIKPEPK